MTINREAAELMALRLTNAVDAAHTLAEALRLATVALQEPREVPEVEPGTVGTATVRCWSDRQRVVRACDDDAKESRPRWLVTDLCEGCGLGWHDDEEITDFVPDPDTAALRAQLDDANRALSELAPIIADLDDDTVHDGSMVDILRSGIARLRGEIRTHEALSAVRPSNAQYAAKIREQVTRADAAEARLALVAGDEHATNISPSQHDPSACGNPGCDC